MMFLHSKESMKCTSNSTPSRSSSQVGLLSVSGVSVQGPGSIISPWVIEGGRVAHFSKLSKA